MKKLLWLILFIIVIVGVVLGIVFARPNETTNDSNTALTTFNKENVTLSAVMKQENQEFIKTELEDGTLYSQTGDIVKADIVIGSNYFDTTINDIYFNPESYYNKNIEIEGMYLQNLPYTFVGRYSVSNLCPYCPPGYSYLEYQLNGKIDKELKDEETWIKIIGTLAKGNDETSNNQDYYYLKVITLEIMKEKGQETVYN